MDITNKKKNQDLKGHIIKLKKFLQAHISNYKDAFTHHMWNAEEHIKYNIPDSKYDEFLELYAAVADNDFGNQHIMEKPADIGPLCLDFDFDFIKENQNLNQDQDQFINSKIFTITEISDIIKEVNKIIIENFKLSKKGKELVAYVLFKNEPTLKISKDGSIKKTENDEKIYKDGFHIQYPLINMSIIDKFFVYDSASTEIIKKGILKNLNIINSIESAFDRSVIKANCWFMYSSGKNINSINQYYELYYKIDKDLNIIEKDIDRVELIKLLSIRKTNLVKIESKTDMLNEYKYLNKKYNLLQKEKEEIISGLMIKNTYNNDDENEESKINLNAKIMNIKNNEKNIINSDIELARKLIKIISSKRASDYNDWIVIGWTLYNISPTLLPEFIEFSKLDKIKYEDGCCKKEWQRCQDWKEYGYKRGYTIGSLKHYAKEDNPEEFKKINIEKVNKLLEEADTNTDNDIAQVIKELYYHEFRCSSIKNKTWHQFENHRWREIDGAYTLSIKMSQELTIDIANLIKSYAELTKTEKGWKADNLQQGINRLNKLWKNLKSKTYKDRMIGECASLFYDEGFIKNLDENHYLIGFNNGVYDLQNNIFRCGNPDDYVSKYTGYDYSEFNINDPIIEEIYKFYKSIQPIQSHMELLLLHSASCLEGYNQDQLMIFFTGFGGSNGKSTHNDLLSRAFGDYAGKIDVTLLTQKKKDCASANPALANTKGVRYIALDEPEGDDKIHIGTMKQLTGQDPISTRGLFKDPITFFPQFKITLSCNELPHIPGSDGGTWRRIVALEFDQQFVDNPIGPKQHKKDPKLREKLEKWRSAFMWLLINKYYKEYKSIGSLQHKIPLEVKKYTEKYKQDSSPYLEFINEFVEINNNESTDFDYFCDYFKQWFERAYNNKKPPPQKKLKDFLRNNNYKIDKNNRILGIKMKEIINNSTNLDLEK